MTSISASTISNIARLSSLSLSDDEKTKLQADLENILQYVKQLDELDTEGIQPSYQVTGLNTVWREDEVKESVPASRLLELAPVSQNNQIKVPKVL